MLFALGDAAETEGLAARVVPCRVGQIGPILVTLAEESIRHVVLAGRIWKDGLFHGMTLDGPGGAVLGRSPDWTDAGLLGAVARTLDDLGIVLMDQRRFLGPWLAAAGVLAGPPPPDSACADIDQGLAIARVLARHGVGQTVVVRAGTVAAVEAMEGTDEAIRRGLGLAGPGAVVIKAIGPVHDYRFDTPAVGPVTLGVCAAGGASALAIEAGRVLLLDLATVEAHAAQAGISVVGFPGESVAP